MPRTVLSSDAVMITGSRVNATEETLAVCPTPVALEELSPSQGPASSVQRMPSFDNPKL